MNFKEFWNSRELDKFRTTEDYCFGTWEACKKEVLKILNNNIRNCSSYPEEGDGYDFDAINLEVIKEIEKL